MVYDDAEKLYAEVKKDGEALLDAAFRVIFPQSRRLPATPADLKTLGGGAALIAYNSTFVPRRDVVRVPLDALGAQSKDALRAQVVQTGEDGRVGYALVDARQGAGLARTVGMFADCMPASGKCFMGYEM